MHGYKNYDPFKLNDDFLSSYASTTPPWGYGDLSWVTYKRTYARKLEKSYLFPDRPEETDEREQWWQTCQRVIEGVKTIQKIHCGQRGLPWESKKARRHARDMYDRLFNFKWTPPGRGLWQMGTDFIFERTGAPLQNCGFYSTKDIDDDFAEPFCWAFEMSMLGVGVGFDTRGAGKVHIQEPEIGGDVHVIEDSREGWRDALRRLLNAFVGKANLPSEWDYSEMRPKGAPIKSFGGVASGPDPLEEMIETLEDMYRERIGQPIDSEVIVDTMNIAGKCVVSGGVRRTAQVALGEPDNEQYLDLKQDPEKVQEYRWASNNSVFAEVGMDYSDVAERTSKNGEPGYFWMGNAQKYGRMKDPADYQEDGIGLNPCCEMILQSGECCTLVESYPAHHDDIGDLLETLKAAYQYGKTVTLVNTHYEKTNQVMQKNRRIGCSMTGIVQAINKHGYRNFIQMCDEGYEYIQHLDKQYSDWLGVPRSVRTTTVKPSGTVSTLSGSTPGVHWGHAPYYIRRIRVQDTSDLIERCRKAGYSVEKDTYADNTYVIEFPVKAENMERGKAEVSLREKVALAARMQAEWSDNGVSCTAEFDPETEADEIPRLLEEYEDKLKAISFLPSEDHGYEQIPYEEISKEEYERRISEIDPISGTIEVEHDREDKFCSGEACKVDPD